MKRVLITGHKGYIGQHLWKMITETRPDIRLHGIDIKSSPMDECRDVRSIAATQDFHTIIHLAALVRVGESVDIPSEYYDVNINGTMNLLKNINCHNFVFASTGAATNPDSPYGYSKRVAEDIVKELAYDYTIFRFYNVTGSDGFKATNPDGLFYNLQNNKTGTYNIYGNDYNTKDGTCVREYVHVNDICRAIIKAIDNPSNSIENLAYGDTRTVKEIVDIYCDVNGLDKPTYNYMPRREGDLEACYLQKPSSYMERNYTYEEMLKVK
jgi:UDP-glucose 4-epimerase